MRSPKCPRCGFPTESWRFTMAADFFRCSTCGSQMEVKKEPQIEKSEEIDVSAADMEKNHQN